MIPWWVCALYPYSDPSLRGIGRRLREAGYARKNSSYGLSWGFGHPRWLLVRDDQDRLVTTCTRCGRESIR